MGDIYEATKRTKMISEAGVPIAIYSRLDRVEEIGAQRADGFRNVRDVANGTPEGWMAGNDLTKVAVAPPVEEIDIPGFIDAARLSANEINSAFPNDLIGMSPEYLLVLAWLESNWRNVAAGVTASSAFGPFQFTEGTWTDLIGNARFSRYAPILDGYTSQDRRDPILQCRAAACYADYLQGKLVEATGKPPSAVLLRIAHLLGEGGGPRFAKLNQGDTIDTQVDGKPAVSAAAINNNPRLLAADPKAAAPTPATRLDVESRVHKELLDGALAATKAAEAAGKRLLGDRLKNVLKVDSMQAPPWLAVARAQQEAGVVEKKGTPSHPAIDSYFKTMGLPGLDDETAWCGAFVSFCLITGGAVTIAEIRSQTNNVPEGAKNWANFGDSLAVPKLGAVVVFKPLADPGSSSGHVGFYVGETDTHINLLGGNQGPAGAVNIRIIPKNMVIDVDPYRWPKVN